MSVPSADLSNKTILTVDDDPSMRAVVRAALERHGCRRVLAAGSGARGLELLAAQPVDLVICDMQMDPMDGLAFLTQARAALPNARFRAIMLTAGSPDHLQGVRDLPIEAWLFKPITGNRLIEAVGAVLGGRIEAVMPEAETDRVLADIAAGAGMDRAVAERLLASDADLDAIKSREAHARQRGVSAVPTFLIANKYVVSGAQPPEMWGKAIAEMTAQAQPES